MGRLADSLLLSKSGVTRLVDRLVEDGLVARTSCASDARGAEATLTALGLARLRAAAPTHLDGIRRYFFAAIEADDLAVVERAMDAISEGLCNGAAHCDPALHDDTEPKTAHRRHGHAAAPDGAGDRLPAGISPGH
jgi:DNA-binding Lrp family transcriptional regulator